MKKRAMRTSAGVVALAVAVAACGGATNATTTTTLATSTTVAAPPTVEVVAVDYGFEGLPDRVVSGTILNLVNESDVELHELVVFRVNDDETRSVEELVADQESLLGYFPTVSAVIIAPPLEGGFPVVGTGQLTQPGRYAIICAIPVGADPAEYLAAAAEAEGGPPEVAGGPPHFVVGMYAEIVVED